MDDIDSAPISDILRDSRLRLGLTQRELAERAGVSLGTVRDYEQGRSAYPSMRSLNALVTVLPISPEQQSTIRRVAARKRPDPVVATVRLTVLGPLSLTRCGAPVVLGSRRRRALLARLALTPNLPVSRDELVAVAWGAVPATEMRSGLHTHISRLRRLLAPGPAGGTGTTIASTPGGYRLTLDQDHLDLLAYRSGLAQARRSQQTEPHRAFEGLVAALDMWQGGTAVEDVPELHGDPLVTAMADEVVDLTIELARLGETLRRSAEVLTRLRLLAARHPWHEALHARLMVALAASGQQSAALDVYDVIRRGLADELGVDPGAELVEARQAVLERTWEHKTQASTVEAGRLLLSMPPALPGFVGRAGQLAEVERLLRSSQRRSGQGPATICVISGMPGLGKTSLALRAAEVVRADFPDGQHYLDLRGADEKPLGVLAALTRLLRGVGGRGQEVPGDEDRAAELYRTMVAGRRVLLVLDNAHSVAQLRPLLPSTGNSAVVVTSRNRCRELTTAVHLHLPVLSVAESVGLLRRHVGSARADEHPQALETVAASCGQLPIALRAVAGPMAVQPYERWGDLVHRLTDASARHRETDARAGAVSASFDLSYQELEAGSAEAFRMAALIPGVTFAPEALAALLASEPEPVAHILDGLAEQSLLQAPDDEQHYRFHDLVRRYAWGRMEASTTAAERSAARGRLAAWYLARTAAAMRLVYPAMVRLPTATDHDPVGFRDVGAAMRWLDDEADNLTALVESSADGPLRAYSWQLADQLRGYFFRSRTAEPWLATGRAGLAAAEAAGDDRARAAMHQTLGQAQWSVGRHKLAVEAYEHGVAAAHRSGWAVGEAYLLHNLGLVHAQLGRAADAHDFYHRALRLATGPDFSHIRAVTLNDLGTLYSEQGRRADAVVQFTAALEINEKAGRRPSAMVNRGNLGMALRQLDQFDTAGVQLRAALDYYREIGSRNGQMAVLDELSHLHRQQGEWHAAVDTATSALEFAEQEGEPFSRAGVRITMGLALLGARAVEDARHHLDVALQLSQAGGYGHLTVQAGVGVADALLALGRLEAARDAAEEALRQADDGEYQILRGDALVVLARVALAGGDHAVAARHCAEAGGAYRRHGADRELQHLDTVLVQVRRDAAMGGGPS